MQVFVYIPTMQDNYYFDYPKESIYLIEFNLTLNNAIVKPHFGQLNHTLHLKNQLDSFKIFVYDFSSTAYTPCPFFNKKSPATKPKVYFFHSQPTKLICKQLFSQARKLLARSETPESNNQPSICWARWCLLFCGARLLSLVQAQVFYLLLSYKVHLREKGNYGTMRRRISKKEFHVAAFKVSSTCPSVVASRNPIQEEK